MGCMQPAGYMFQTLDVNVNVEKKEIVFLLRSLHSVCTNVLGKGTNASLLLPAMSKLEQTGFSALD